MAAGGVAGILMRLEVGLGTLVLRTGSEELELRLAEVTESFRVGVVGLALLL